VQTGLTSGGFIVIILFFFIPIDKSQRQITKELGEPNCDGQGFWMLGQLNYTLSSKWPLEQKQLYTQCPIVVVPKYLQP